MTTTDRKLAVLRAIVSEYVQTGEPVSSKTVADRHVRGVSSATIRNDMAVLEEEGLISQPHTSSGRIPTEAGYRLFVDHLTELQPLTVGQRRAIHEFMEGTVDFDDVVGTAVRLLAELTQHASILEYPTLSAERLRRIELVDLPGGRLLVIVITDAGRVAEKQVDYRAQLTGQQGRNPRKASPKEAGGSGPEVDRTNLVDLRDWLNEQVANLPCYRVGEALTSALQDPQCRYRGDGLAQLVVEQLEALTRLAPSARIMVAGASNLARSGMTVSDAAPILDALEEQVALLRLLHEVHTLPVQVSIGTENREARLSDAAVVSATYETQGSRLAHVAIVGPTRMNYPRSLVAVRAVSNYLSGILLGRGDLLRGRQFDEQIASPRGEMDR